MKKNIHVCIGIFSWISILFIFGIQVFLKTIPVGTFFVLFLLMQMILTVNETVILTILCIERKQSKRKTEMRYVLYCILNLGVLLFCLYTLAILFFFF